MNISKATPLTGEEWRSNAMMQVPGKWLGLPLHHVLFPTWGSAGPGWAGLLLWGQVSVVWEQVACCSSATVFDPRCVGPSMIDVSPQDLTHRSPAAGLAAAGRAPRSTHYSELKSGLNILRAAALLFIYLLESPGTEIQLPSSPLWVMCPCAFIHLCLFFCCRLGGNSGEKKYWCCLIYASYVFVFESEFLFNNTPGPLFPGAARMKRHFFFNCRGCNSMLSKPIVEQKLHLFFSWLIFWGCCSSRRLDRNYYAASKTSKKSVKATKTYISIQKPVFTSSQRREYLR